MSANTKSAAPKGRTKLAQGKAAAPAADAALGHDSPNTSSPEGAKKAWRTVALGEIAEINPRPGSDELNDDSLASFIPMKSVEEESGQFQPLGDKKVGEVRKGYTPFRDGDVLFAKVTPCMENGKAAVMKELTNGVGFGSTEFFALRPKSGLDAHYLFHFILQSSFRREAAKNMTGAVGLRRVPKTWLEQQTIPLPPPDEQRRIVAEIEKQFTRLEAGVAALRRVQANLKRYRAAVLKAACEGKIVDNEMRVAKAEGRSVETGEQLLKRILAERRAAALSRRSERGGGKYKEPAAPDTANLPPPPNGWAWASLEAIADVIDPNPSHRMPKYVPEGIPLISSENFTETEGIDFSIGKKVTNETLNDQRSRYEIEDGDFALSRIGTIGKTRLLPTDKDYCLSHALVVIKVRSDGISKRWLRKTISSESILSQAHSSVQSVGVPDLGMAKIRQFAIPLPPLAEQTRIVAEVERRLSVVEELESVVSANLQRATRLRQSILQKAFTGES